MYYFVEVPVYLHLYFCCICELHVVLVCIWLSLRVSCLDIIESETL